MRTRGFAVFPLALLPASAWAAECARDTDCSGGKWCSAAGQCEAGPARSPAAAPAGPPAEGPGGAASPPPKKWPAFFVSGWLGLGGAYEAYLEGRGNEGFAGFLLAFTGSVGAALSEQFAVGVDVSFLPMLGDGSFAPFGAVGAFGAWRPSPWVQLEATLGVTGGGVVAFGGVGPGWSVGVGIPVFTRGRSSLVVGARLPMAYLIEPRTTSNTSFYIGPTANIGYTLW